MRWVVAFVLVGCSYEPTRSATSNDASPDADATALDAPNGTDAVAIDAARVFGCDGPEDCGANQVCCNDQNGSACANVHACKNDRREVCHVANDCTDSSCSCDFSSDFGQSICCP